MRLSKINSLLLAVALIMTISLSACGDSADTNSMASPPSGTPDKEIIINSEDINDTLEIVILSSDGDRLVSLDSADIEKVVIPESDDDGYYEVVFWLTPNAVLKADKVVPRISDFPVDISIDDKTFEFFTSDDALYHYSRAISSASDGVLMGFDCPLFESNITREDFRVLFTKYCD